METNGEFPPDLIEYIVHVSQDPILAARIGGTCKRYRKHVMRFSWATRWKTYSPSRGLYEASWAGNRRLVDLYISSGAKKWNLALAFYGAARGGHRDLVDFFISKGVNDWKWGFYGAALVGHGDLVDFFISKGAAELKGAANLNWGLRRAVSEGHQKLIEFFRAKINENKNR